MNLILPIARQAECLRKRAYSTDGDAWAVLGNMASRGQDVDALMPYSCAVCSQWHIGPVPSLIASTA